jgi:hypothetical protein
VTVKEDEEDPEIALVDIGGVHDPERSNFDHHHFPREHPPTCALSLVLQHLGLYEDALVFCDWLKPAEWFDSRGPNQTAEFLGIERSVIAQLNSPIDVTLLRRFARARELKAGEPLYEVMRFIGEDLLEFILTARRRLDKTASQARVWTMELSGQPRKVAFLPRDDSAMDEPSASLSRYVRALGLEDVIALVYPDRRGEGYGITRYEDHPQLDFARVEGESDVHFAHTTGFMCKTSAREEARLQDLVQAAWI